MAEETFSQRRQMPLGRSAIIAAVVLTVAIAGSFVLRSFITKAVDRTREYRQEAEGAALAANVAAETRKALGDREDLAADIENLVPPLTEIGGSEQELDILLRDLFTRRPSVELGASVDHPGDSAFQQIDFTIKGRMRVENFGNALDRLSAFPNLLQVNSAALDLSAVASENEGEALFLGTLFARF